MKCKKFTKNIKFIFEKIITRPTRSKIYRCDSSLTSMVAMDFKESKDLNDSKNLNDSNDSINSNDSNDSNDFSMDFYN